MKIRNLVPWREETRTPARWEGDPFARLQGEINRLFDGGLSLFSQGSSPVGFVEKLNSFTPKIDVVENDKEVCVKAELPGMTDKDISIELTNDCVTIRGEKKHEEERKEGDVTYYESSYGSFQRVVPLTSLIAEDKVDCSIKNGVMRLVLPKRADASRDRRKISVRAEK
jgi:HSP20 family protein